MQISEKMKQGCQLDGLEFCDQEGYLRAAPFKTLNINITGRCNQRCVYCSFSQHGYHRLGSDIDADLFYKVTKEARDLGVTDVGLYTSGEPFLNPNLCQYITWCKKAGFPYVYLSTNGLLCTLENFKKVAAAGLDSLKFSISGGNRSTFYKHHGVDRFDLVKQNVIQAYEYREKEHFNLKLFMFVIVTKYNADEKELIRDTFGPYVDEIVFTNCINDNVMPMIGIDEYLAPGPDTQSLLPRQIIPCPELFNKIVVDEDGWLCACCASKNHVKLVDLKSTTLWEALNCKPLQVLRKKHLLHDVRGTLCQNCISGEFKRENMHSMNPAFEYACKDIAPIDIRSDIIQRFQPDASDDNQKSERPQRHSQTLA